MSAWNSLLEREGAALPYNRQQVIIAFDSTPYHKPKYKMAYFDDGWFYIGNGPYSPNSMAPAYVNSNNANRVFGWKSFEGIEI